MIRHFIYGMGLALFAIFANSPSYAQTRLSINQFIDQALENHPAMLAAQANVAAAKARERASGQILYNPELTAQKENALENTSSVGLNQTIDWVNKRGARHQVGEANLHIAKAQHADLRQQIAAQIFVALVKYQAKQQVVSFAKRRTSLFQEFVELSQKLYKNGDIARVDLDLARLALAEALSQQADAEVSVIQALQSIRTTTGYTGKQVPRIVLPLPNLILNPTDVDRFMNTLPAIAVLNHQYQMAQARLKSAERDRFPDPTIGIQGGESSSEGQSKRLIGLTLNLPLFILNPYKAEVDAANFDAIEAAEKRADLVRQASAQMMSSAERYQTLHRATEQWQMVSGKALSDSAAIIQGLWQAGEINTTDYLVHLKQRIDSQISGVELKERTWEIWIEWLKASGQVDQWLQLKSQPLGEM